jgi:hypothetical protein
MDPKMMPPFPMKFHSFFREPRVLIHSTNYLSRFQKKKWWAIRRQMMGRNYKPATTVLRNEKVLSGGLAGRRWQDAEVALQGPGQGFGYQGVALFIEVKFIVKH